MDQNSYHVQQDALIHEQIGKMAEKLPAACGDYITYLERIKTKQTTKEYLKDLTNFFQYVADHVFHKDMKDLTMQDFSKIRQQDVEQYLTGITAYQKQVGNQIKFLQNSHVSINRKLSSIKSFFRYNYRIGHLPKDQVQFIDHFRIRDVHDPISLTAEETERLFNAINQPDKNASPQTQYYQTINRDRDTAITTLLLGTGIRVSELVGINLSDINWYDCSIEVRRKGQWTDYVYFGDEVETALQQYIKQRNLITPQEGSEDALFLSTQRKRISVRAVEVMVEKYKKRAGIEKHITPHKLRSTFGTHMYAQTGDIMLVRDLLGHSNVQTTMRYVSKQDRIKRQNAAHNFKIHDEE